MTQRDHTLYEEPTVYRFWQHVVHTANSMGTHEWMLAMAAVIVLGLFCVRGFGSRSKY